MRGNKRQNNRLLARALAAKGDEAGVRAAMREFTRIAVEEEGLWPFALLMNFPTEPQNPAEVDPLLELQKLNLQAGAGMRRPVFRSPRRPCPLERNVRKS